MPEIARITVSLRIVGDALDPDEITRRLGAEPTGFARKGDTRHMASGREVIARRGIWLLGTDTSGDLNTQIAALLAKLPDDPSILADLSHRYRCDILCGLFMHDINEGTELQPRLLSARVACDSALISMVILTDHLSRQA